MSCVGTVRLENLCFLCCLSVSDVRNLGTLLASVSMFTPRSSQCDQWYPPFVHNCHIGGVFHLSFVPIKGGSSVAKVVTINAKVNRKIVLDTYNYFLAYYAQGLREASSHPVQMYQKSTGFNRGMSSDQRGRFACV